MVGGIMTSRNSTSLKAANIQSIYAIMDQSKQWNTIAQARNAQTL